MYIKKFNADTIKIDRSFIQALEEDENSERIVSAIMNLAKVLELNVVAEGIETKEQYIKLKQMKVNEMQGYFFCKSLSSQEIEKYFRKNDLNGKNKS